MKKVLLCCPFTKGNLFETRWVVPHFGMWRLASFLNANGQYTEVYDCNNPTNGLTFEQVLVKEKWDFVGFSLLEATLEYDAAMIFKARRILPKVIFLAGGSGAALNYQYILDNLPIDIVVLAEGEYTMMDLCTKERWQEVSGIVFKNKAKVISAEDFWKITNNLCLKEMQVNNYWSKTASLYERPNLKEINTFRVFTSNYCPLGCKFCTLSLWKKQACGYLPKVIGLDVEQLIVLIKNIVKVYSNVMQIYFTDDDFFILRKEREEFCKRVILEKLIGELPFSLGFIIMTNINRITNDNLGLMEKMGVNVLSIGVESVSQHKLDSLAKKQKVSVIWDVTNKILRTKIKPYYTLLMFTPRETIDDLITDLMGFRRMSDLGVGISVEPYLIPLPGTPFWEERIPMSIRNISIEGTDLKIEKGFAWLPQDVKVRAVFDEYEKWYPKYKRYRFEIDGVGHKEKNYQGNIIIDALEIVLKTKFSYEFKSKFQRGLELNRLYRKVDDLPSLDVDIVGDFVYG